MVRFKKILLYLGFAIIIFSGQFLYNGSMATGTPPKLSDYTITGQEVKSVGKSAPGIIYFWAEWCGICAMMQEPVSKILHDYPVMTVALKSGTDQELREYLTKQQLNWPVINDQQGFIANRYGVKGVPALFIYNREGQIIFTSIGYSTELGIKFRLWLAEFF